VSPPQGRVPTSGKDCTVRDDLDLVGAAVSCACHLDRSNHSGIIIVGLNWRSEVENYLLCNNVAHCSNTFLPLQLAPFTPSLSSKWRLCRPGARG
jgi:hypothetical protein